MCSVLNMSSFVNFIMLFAVSCVIPVKGRYTKDAESSLPIFQDHAALKDGQENSLYSPDTLKILAEKIMEMISKGEDISQDDLPDDLKKLVSSIESVCKDDNEVKNSKDSKKSHRQGRRILESFRQSKRGRSLLNDGASDLQQLQPDKLEELILDIELLCDLDKQSNTTREGRGLLSRLSFLTGLHFGSIFSGSGTIAATQSLHILGRIINSALSVSYGPSSINRPEIGGIGGSLIPTVPIADELPVAPFNEVEDQHNHRVKIKHPHTFLWDHNKRVENFNTAVNSSSNFRQGRMK